VIDEAARLRAEIEVLGQELAEMELELATAQGELARFTEHYHRIVAGRMAELDRLQADLATLRRQSKPDDPSLDEAAKQAEARAGQSRRENDSFKTKDSQESGRFAPSNDLKKQFRQLAQKIHPDRATNEDDRAWRTHLMSEANRAYRTGDACALDEVLTLWLEGQQSGRSSPAGAAPPAPTFSETAALEEEATKIRRRIAAIVTELDRLYGSKLYELFAAARVAARQGRDLLQEMANRLDNQIDLKKCELDRLSLAAEASAA
jgi:hypothetical protein